MTASPADTRALEVTALALVGAAFTNIYVTQPILPALEAEFATDTVHAAQSVSMVLAGIAVANLPFGFLADRLPLHRILAWGAAAIAAAGLACALTTHLGLLLGARFAQGLFIPALTTCLAAYLAKTLPAARLNVVMGAYVAATVLGGMLGRLLGGLVEPLAGWRVAFVVAAALVAGGGLLAVRLLPAAPHTHAPAHRAVRYRDLLRRRELLGVLLCGGCGQAIFSPVFNTLPYRLGEPPLGLDTRQATLLYLVYLVGIWIGPASGRLSNRIGNGNTLVAGSLCLLAGLGLLLVAALPAIVAGLLAVCGGFFAVHAAAVGALNRKLDAGQGRANALYVMVYYLGASLGVSWSAWVYQRAGWTAMIAVAMGLALVPLSIGARERRAAGAM
ncbi:MAG: MFS transporter [Gammaproteobacteria bacterium]|nr:MFS transporter [Gammaproteobacteria bacterium]